MNSIISQNLKEIEIIIVNDGSTDNSLEIINEFIRQDKRMILINKKNGGLSSARNSGLKVAKGEYVLHIDSDDWIEQDYFLNMYQYAKKYGCDIVISNFYTEYSNKTKALTKGVKTTKKFLSASEGLNILFEGKMPPCVWNKLFKLSLYKENNIEHPVHISMGEDLATTPLLISHCKKIGILEKAYIHYIYNEYSITKSNPLKKIKDIENTIDILQNKLNNKIKQIDIDTLYINSIGTLFYFNKIDGYENEFNNFKKNIKKINFVNSSLKLKIAFYVFKIFPFKITCELINWFHKFIIFIKTR